MFGNKPFTFDRVIRLALTAGIIWGLVRLMGYLSDVLIPFFAALLLAYLINPLVVRVQRKVKHHLLAVFISLIIVAAAVVVLGMLVIPVIVGEVTHMGRVLSDLVTNTKVAEQAAKNLPPDIWNWLKDLASRPEVQQLFKTDSFISLAQTLARRILPGVWGLITGTTSLLMGLVGLGIILLYLVFLLIDYQKVKEGWEGLIPPAHRETIFEFFREFNTAMHRYFRAQALVAALVGVLTATGFWLIGLPLGILLGLFIGLLNMVPYLQLLGVPVALILAVVHALDIGASIWLYLALTCLVFVVVQALQDGFLAPRIMGQAMGLSPAVILLSLSIWGKLLGFLGLLIALPMTCLVLAYYRRFLVSSSAAAKAPPAPALSPLPTPEITPAGDKAPGRVDDA